MYRLGCTHTDKEVSGVLLALNLLLPYGLSRELSDAEAFTSTAASRGDWGASLISSVEVAGNNEKLKAYIERNAMMLLDFLRQVSATRAPSEVPSERQPSAPQAQSECLRTAF